MNLIIKMLNKVLSNPTEENIFSLFVREGFIRFNMLYVNPIALKHLKEKLEEYKLVSWGFAENELIFKLKSQVISFKGTLSITQTPNIKNSIEPLLNDKETDNYSDSSANFKIFALELDFDPVISSNDGIAFLKDVEAFLKMCDTCFFMTYFICIDFV